MSATGFTLTLTLTRAADAARPASDQGALVLLDDVLIPVEFLVNHRSILWDDPAQRMRIDHVELETHDVLMANGAPAESYRDDGTRWLFTNANAGWSLPPQAPCVPVLTGGPEPVRGRRRRVSHWAVGIGGHVQHRLGRRPNAQPSDPD
jgi:hypothetical protein